MLCERYRWRWKDVRRRFTTPTGQWLPVTAGEVELKRIAAIPIIRYRYRGSQIPSPWALNPPDGRDRGEPVASRGARRVRREVRGNGLGAIPAPRPGPTQRALTRAKTSGQGRSGLDKGTLAAALFGLGRAGQRQPDRRTAYGPPPLVKSAAPFARGCRQPDGSGAKSGETMTTRATASAGNDGDGPRPGRRPGAPSLARGR